MSWDNEGTDAPTHTPRILLAILILALAIIACGKVRIVQVQNDGTAIIDDGTITSNVLLVNPNDSGNCAERVDKEGYQWKRIDCE